VCSTPVPGVNGVPLRTVRLQSAQAKLVMPLPPFIAKRLVPVVWVTASVVMSGCGQVMERLSGKNDQETSRQAPVTSSPRQTTPAPQTASQAKGLVEPPALPQASAVVQTPASPQTPAATQAPSSAQPKVLSEPVTQSKAQVTIEQAPASTAGPKIYRSSDARRP
jgi:hypothetical protein